MTDGFHAADDGSLARSTGGAAARGALLIALAIVIGLLLLTFALNDDETELVVEETEQVDEEGAEDGDGGDAAVASGEASDGDGDGDGDGEGGDGDGDAAGSDEDPDTIPEEPIDGATTTGRPPSEVNVLVANGVGTAGIAGSTADVLIADGYIGVAADAPDTPASVILYKEGFDADALAIAAVLGAPPDVVLSLIHI